MNAVRAIVGKLAQDIRIAVGAFTVAAALAVATPTVAGAVGLCPGDETTGCIGCDSPPGPGWFYCACCEDTQGAPTCLYCRAD